jgi:hypothetical protein
MAVRTPRIQGLLDLWAARCELSTLEWLEFRQTILAAAWWIVCAAIYGLASWLALNTRIALGAAHVVLGVSRTIKCSSVP